MPTNSQPLLTVNTLSAVIGRQGVLHNVNLEVARGDWLAVVGGSGAGKSTLMRVIMGLRRPARPVSGTMSFRGQSYDLSQPPSLKGQTLAGQTGGIAFVPQSPAHGLDPLRKMIWQWQQLMRVKKLLASTTNPEAVQRQRQLFTAMGLPEPDARYPHQWSLGMQQRFLLAMALMESPQLLILDEPTSALDAMIAAQVLREVQRLVAERGITVMMVTHDLELAARFARSVAIMTQGALVEQGPCQQVLRSPSHSYTQELVAHRKWRLAPQTGWVKLC